MRDVKISALGIRTSRPSYVWIWRRRSSMFSNVLAVSPIGFGRRSGTAASKQQHATDEVGEDVFQRETDCDPAEPKSRGIVSRFMPAALKVTRVPMIQTT